MYRVFVMSSGKYHNVTIGHRYCFRKKTAKRLIDQFLELECSINVEKLIRLTSDVFYWSELEEDKVLDYFLKEREGGLR